MKSICFVVRVAYVAVFSSCQMGGTYYCRTYTLSNNGMSLTYNDDAVKKWFVSYKAMQNYEQENKRKCEQKK